MNSRAPEAEAVSRRRLILHSAGLLFAERGYIDTGIDDIGEGAGITGPGIYRHFSGKQEILDELLVGHMQEVLNQARQVTACAGPPAKVLEHLLAARVDISLGPSGYVATVFQHDEIYCSLATRAKLRSMRQAYEDEWLRVLILIRPDVRTAALRISIHGTLVLIGYGSMRVLRGDQVATHLVDTASLRSQLISMARAAILAPVDDEVSA
jgi:AcrR family transcriptional regulator